MVRFVSFGRSGLSLSPVSASVSLRRSLGLGRALWVRFGRPSVGFDFDGLGLASLSFAFGPGRWLSVPCPRVLPWLFGLRSRFRDARSDPFFPASRWEALVLAVRSVR